LERLERRCCRLLVGSGPRLLPALGWLGAYPRLPPESQRLGLGRAFLLQVLPEQAFLPGALLFPLRPALVPPRRSALVSPLGSAYLRPVLEGPNWEARRCRIRLHRCRRWSRER
jgi:hypothetical protein